jgi:hypothetical protein
MPHFMRSAVSHLNINRATLSLNTKFPKQYCKANQEGLTPCFTTVRPSIPAEVAAADLATAVVAA